MFKHKAEPEAPLVEDPPEFPKDHSSHNGSYTLYTVEARCTDKKPMQAGKQLLGNEWQTVEFAETTPFGVPSERRMAEFTGRDHGLYPHAAAQALRWWVHADVEAHGSAYYLETRLVAHKVTYSKKVVAESAADIVSRA